MIVDDHAILRQGIKLLLDLQNDIEVVADVGSGIEALKILNEAQPDVLILDISMQDLSGLEVLEICKKNYSKLKVIILSQYESGEYVLPAIKHGAEGYVVKRNASDHLVMAIRQVYEGNNYLSPEIISIVIGGVANDNDLLEDITDREKEVIVLISKGFTLKEVGKQLFISSKTVEFHKTNAFKKLGLKNRSEMMNFVIKKGWLN